MLRERPPCRPGASLSPPTPRPGGTSYPVAVHGVDTVSTCWTHVSPRERSCQTRPKDAVVISANFPVGLLSAWTAAGSAQRASCRHRLEDTSPAPASAIATNAEFHSDGGAATSGGHAHQRACGMSTRGGRVPAECLRSGFELFWGEPRSPARWLRVSLWSQHGCRGRPLKETSFAPGHLTEARGHSTPRTGPERSWRIVSCPPRYTLSSETVRSQPSPFQSCLTTPRCMVLGAPSGWTVRTHPPPPTPLARALSSPRTPRPRPGTPGRHTGSS